MSFKVILASVGNIDKGQDPDRPLPGVLTKTVEVQDYAEASKICREYIRDNDLGVGNWAGGKIMEGTKLIAKVSYNGAVWAEPLKMADRPLFDPRVKSEAKVDLLAKFAREEARIEVPGYGHILISASLGHSALKSSPGEFMIGTIPHEFMTAATMDRNGYQCSSEGIVFHPDGIWEKTTRNKVAQLAIETAVREWCHTAAGKEIVLQNTLKDQQQQLFVLNRNVGYAEVELQKLRMQLTNQQEMVKELEFEIEGLSSTPVSKM